MSEDRIKWLEEQIDNHSDLIHELSLTENEKIKEHAEIIRKYRVELITLKFS